jgi:hypothetical protein
MLQDPRFIRYFDKFAGTTVIDLRKHDTVQNKKTKKETTVAEQENKET